MDELIKVSECCGVEFEEDYGICPDCLEHCVGVLFDEDGQEVEVND